MEPECALAQNGVTRSMPERPKGTLSKSFRKSCDTQGNRRDRRERRESTEIESLSDLCRDSSSYYGMRY